MDLNKIELEILDKIKESKVDTYTTFTMQIAMAQFCYLLNCLEKDFKDKQKQEELNKSTREQ